jgi:NAD(P)-dependent dehydrogenase (short-subunit alcohol dehydrogenase family)
MAGEARDFKSKTVIITGGGSGVGFETAKQFARAGANILITSRNAEKLNSACETLGEQSAYLVGDVSQSKTAQAAMASCQDRFGGPADILINNAGVILRKTAEETLNDEWEHVMAVNVTGAFNFSRAFAKQCLGEGAIVNVSSTCGQVGSAGLAAYCASKGAVDQLTRSMALELAPRSITVNAVAPGAINSPMLFSKHDDKGRAKSVISRNVESIPLGTIAEPSEVARAILFLAREGHITGTILSIDGGYTAV